MVAAARGAPVVHGAPPAGYEEVPGSPDVLLNPSHRGARGSTFPNHDCEGVPDPPEAGEVVWHFILPQSALENRPMPGNIFDDLTVTFASGRVVNLSAAGEFGPPSQAHVYITTPTDDVLQNGHGDIFRDGLLQRANDPLFNLSHTCVGPDASTTTTTSTTSTITTPTSTTPLASDPATTPAAPTTSTEGAGGGVVLTTPAAPATTSTGGAGGGVVTTGASGLPFTGADDGIAIVALIVLATGIVLAVMARRPPTT
jgi:hypothetical protein